MAMGKVKWFNEKKGFGFLTQNNGGDDVFVHYSNIDTPGFKTLVEGESVTFECKQNAKGLTATAVKKV